MTTKDDKAVPEAGAEEELLPKGAASEADDADDEPSIEDLAIEAGWTPKGKWKGDPGKWVSASEHLRRTAKSAKNLAKKLTDREQALENKEAEFDDRIKRLEAVSTTARKRELAALKTHYQTQLDAAIESKDPDAVKQALKDRDEAFEELETTDKPEMSDAQFVDGFKPMHATAQKPFWTENPWLLSDDDEAEEAFAEVEEIIQSVIDGATEGKRPPTYEEMERAVAAAERHVKRSYKHRSEPEEEAAPAIQDTEEVEEEPAPKAKPTASKRIPVLAGGSRGRGGADDLVARMPPEARKAAAADVKAGLFTDDHEYAVEYWRGLGENV